MSKIIVPLLAFIAVILVTADELENSANLCQKCKCTNATVEFTLDCNNQQMHNVLAVWPPHNKTLKATFSYNNINTLKILPRSDHVVELVYAHCGIKNMDPGVFKDVKNVEFVDLSYNLLETEEISPEKFKGPPNNNSEYEPIAIKHLNLAYNKIHSLSNNLFEHMPDLEQLNLEGNCMHVLDTSTQLALSSLSKLERLNLAYNSLTELVASAITGLHNLIELNLAGNNFDFVPFELPAVGKTLEILILDGNPIIEIEDSSFLDLRNIIDLSLNNLTALKIVKANSFAPMFKLRKLQMSLNRKLQHLDKEAFAPNQTLQELYLNNNSLTFIDFELTTWSTLKVLEMNDNPLDCSCHLYYIARNLSVEITRNRDGPICTDEYTGKSKQVFSLSREICHETDDHPLVLHQIGRHFTLLRIVLLSFSVILTVTMIVLLVLGFTRYRRYARLRRYSFVTQVAYNPLNNQRI